MKKEILRMQDVCAGDFEPYGLDGFRLHICEGEMVNLIGLSGAGKTMVYEFFLGNVILKKGKVIYNGKLTHAGERFGQVTDVVCVGMESTLIPGLSIAENIFIITGRRKIKSFLRMRDILYRGRIFLSQYAPELSPDTLVRELSPADQRMVELLRAIENEVKLVIIDDVLKGYGQSDVRRLMELLKVIKDKGIAILYGSHEVDFTKMLVDKAVVIRKGRTIRTFYTEDYSETLCKQLLVGNEMPPKFERSTVVNPKIAFQAHGLIDEQYVKNIDLEIHAGEIVGLYDMNNRTNLALAEMIIGERTILDGHMYLEEKPYYPKDIDHAVDCNIGFIPKNMDYVSLVESMSFMDNLYLPVMQKTSHLKIFRDLKVSEFLGKEYMESLGIPLEEKDKEVKYFDAYIQNSILLTRWILFQPVLMVCMEPCGNADIIMRDIIFRAFSELAGNKTAILIASQNMNELKTICDSVYVVNSGGVDGGGKYWIR